ncbi:hypothetical protein [Granulicella sp. L60]|uniref:hypothetical protein n=1 Tax=Granulicella sp. L60 TaxID=1641866 RepID=UPI00131B8BFE|nr:hypothetical protein [Granulicella sp. L60]
MDQTTLVNFDVEAGLKTLAALDEAHIKTIVALWMVSPDDDGRLVISSPDIEQFQLLKAYQQVAKVLHGRFPYMTPPILILPTSSPFVRELRRMFGKTKDVSGMRLGGQTIGGRFISDAYVYRIK